MCVVGDDDQCIYSWRGAEVRNILDFERYFPGGKEVRLEQNYRSTQLILDAANAVIGKNPERRAKRMWSDNVGGAKIRVVTAPTEEEEARFVAAEIKRAIDDGISPDEIAVLYRTNGQSRPVEEFLREKGVRYEVIGGSVVLRPSRDQRRHRLLPRHREPERRDLAPAHRERARARHRRRHDGAHDCVVARQRGALCGTR